MAHKKQIILPIAILVVGIIAYLGFASLKTPPEEKAEVDNTPIVAVETILVAPMTLHVSSYGIVKPKYETSLVAQVNGEIVELNDAFVRGGFVKKGHTYLVGESGRELFTPSENGNITSNKDLERQNSTQTAPVINLNISANDSTGFDELLVKRKNLLVGIISQAMNQKGNTGLV